jgi:hypothetical protein
MRVKHLLLTFCLIGFAQPVLAQQSADQRVVCGPKLGCRMITLRPLRPGCRRVSLGGVRRGLRSKVVCDRTA